MTMLFGKGRLPKKVPLGYSYGTGSSDRKLIDLLLSPHTFPARADCCLAVAGWPALVSLASL